jgi:hypothetical protein
MIFHGKEPSERSVPRAPITVVYQLAGILSGKKPSEPLIAACAPSAHRRRACDSSARCNRVGIPRALRRA